MSRRYESESESDREYVFKGRYVRTINDSDFNYDSDSENSFIISDSIRDSISDSNSDSITDSNNINSIKQKDNVNSLNQLENKDSLVSSNDKIKNDSYIKTYSCRVIKKLNKDNDVVTVPTPYINFLELFNEKNCDILPPHREYDCEIKLKENSSLFYGPLYSLNEVEREELKKYLKENLNKGFIRKSTSPAGAPILFVKKKRWIIKIMC